MSHPFQLNQFETGVAPAWPPAVPAIWFLFWGYRLLVQRSPHQKTMLQKTAEKPATSSRQLPRAQKLMELGPQILDPKCWGLNPPSEENWREVGERSQFLGFLQQQPCYAVDLSAPSALWPPSSDSSPSSSLNETQPAQASIPELQQGYEFVGLKRLYGALPESEFALAGRAVQMLSWERNHRFCGHCATPLKQMPNEGAKRCSSCGLRHYPRLSPAVIVRVTRGEEILLARSPRFRPGMYSVLAGFVEPGESLEDTIEREVKEEVGVTVQNIRYFGSQPWPFPNSLMLAFTADYAGGELIPEAGEIEDVAWFTRSTLPPIPGPLSIASRLIDDFAQR